MRWMRCEHEGRPRLGLVEGDAVLLHEGGLFGPPQPTGQRLALEGLQWLPPCEPGQIVGLWNNFRAAAAKNGWAEPAEPLYFLKSPAAASGHGARVPAAAPEVGRVAFEGELAIVIGRAAHRLSRDEAAGAIFGYTLANDYTALELLNRDASFAQWARAKSLPGFANLGPWIDTGFDPAAATLRTRVGGRERQNYPLDDMFFAPAELVWRISQDLLLRPGDVILCGTSLGVLPLKPGTEVEVEVEGLGLLRSTYG
ncbi:MAG: fumarylacetoacetate hydrolase family protein [Burkholderiaceae bacterium]|jgi:2-keto-4-pentenoate hydratase/2-oxohepta-3-ene-1,7-dioic acid hydratase in catechol pathway|nr:fumarylacetoacetate hydrolase family protein [Burkholderiaceae bacterium]MCZ8175334.1 fumarylacetoacetate hydrolase family protein [Burkholderiaceae bacterium]